MGTRVDSGFVVGNAVGFTDGRKLGASDGSVLGSTLGSTVGSLLEREEYFEGLSEGQDVVGLLVDGSCVGASVGTLDCGVDGRKVGAFDGLDEGAQDGRNDGFIVRSGLGLLVGTVVGVNVAS